MRYGRVLSNHEEWLNDKPSGIRADFSDQNLSGENLSGCNLSYADFRHTDLSCCNLSGCNLSYADFRYADLSGAYWNGASLICADLSGADLSGADLSGADLSGVDLSGTAGIICLPIGDPRGYRPVAVRHEEGYMIAAGCHWFTLAQAREHWGDAYEGDRGIGDQYLAGIDWLEAQGNLS